ncbi:DUF402 domain-containing protein, partial [Streptomyces cavourensis]|nr:DUF402 domain-containing protein [Streptomyces cavourensis]
ASVRALIAYEVRTRERAAATPGRPARRPAALDELERLARTEALRGLRDLLT